MLTLEQKKELILALVKGGYNPIDATNVANGDQAIAEQRYKEYCKFDNDRVIAFFNKYNGNYIDIDGAYGNQCVDLMRKYIKDVLGLNPYVLKAEIGAKYIFYNFTATNYFQKIYNQTWNPLSYPRLGDIVFFKNGYYGHVSINDNSNFYKLRTFDQNYPEWGDPCHFVNHSYIRDGVIGWLRPNNLKIK